MSEFSQDDMKLIEAKLKGIEDKIGSKWTVPILVAVISGLIGMATVVMQAKLDGDRSVAELKQTTASKQQEEERQELKQLHYKASEFMTNIRDGFEDQCGGSAANSEQLDVTLRNFRRFIRSNRAQLGEDYASSLLAYPKWVAESTFDPAGARCVDDKDSQYENAAKILTDFYNRRCKPTVEIEPTVGFLGLRQ
jgi:hypothetical protein